MNFFQMLSAVEAVQKKQQTAVGKKEFKMPAVAAADAEASADPAPAEPKKKTKKKEIIPEGNEAENVLQPDEPEEDDEKEE